MILHWSFCILTFSTVKLVCDSLSEKQNGQNVTVKQKIADNMLTSVCNINTAPMNAYIYTIPTCIGYILYSFNIILHSGAFNLSVTFCLRWKSIITIMLVLTASLSDILKLHNKSLMLTVWSVTIPKVTLTCSNPRAPFNPCNYGNWPIFHAQMVPG